MQQRSKAKQIVVPVTLVVAGWMIMVIAVAVSLGVM